MRTMEVRLTDRIPQFAMKHAYDNAMRTLKPPTVIRPASDFEAESDPSGAPYVHHDVGDHMHDLFSDAIAADPASADAALVAGGDNPSDTGLGQILDSTSFVQTPQDDVSHMTGSATGCLRNSRYVQRRFPMASGANFFAHNNARFSPIRRC